MLILIDIISLVLIVVGAIPELNSSQLISKQIEILESNNEKIKELKDKVARLSASKWWLYFGG